MCRASTARTRVWRGGSRGRRGGGTSRGGLYRGVRAGRQEQERRQQERLEMARRVAANPERFRRKEKPPKRRTEGGGMLEGGAVEECGGDTDSTGTWESEYEEIRSLGGMESESDDEIPLGDLAERERQSKEHKGKLEERVQRLETAGALIVHSEKIAEKFLKEKNIKLRKGRKYQPLKQYNHTAWKQGEADSKQIDLNQQAICGGGGKKRGGAGGGGGKGAKRVKGA